VPFFQARQIHMTREGAMGECLGEVRRVDVVMEQRPDLNGEIVMAVWEPIVSLNVR
jgi:hypothetical protein